MVKYFCSLSGYNRMKNFLSSSINAIKEINGEKYLIEFKYKPDIDERAFIMIYHNGIEVLNSWISLKGLSMAKDQSFYISHFSYDPNHKSLMIEVLNSFLWVYSQLDGSCEFAIGSPKYLFKVFKEEFKLEDNDRSIIIPSKFIASTEYLFPWMLLEQEE